MKYERLTTRYRTRLVSTFQDLEELICRLRELENKIEDGTLIELPCKVGETLFRICPQAGRIKYGQMWDGKIVERPCQRCPWEYCQCTEIGFQKDMDNIVQERKMFSLEQIGRIIPLIGRNWFKTREEAEAKLKELKDESTLKDK